MADVNTATTPQWTPAALRAHDVSLDERLTLDARRLKLLLAQNVSAARHHAGLTQSQLASKAELSRATVHLIEAGICDPRLSTITRLAGALEVNAMVLLTRVDAPAVK